MDFGRANFPPAEAGLSPTESTSDSALLPAAQEDLWAGRVRASMRKTFTGVLETGKILVQAQAELPHGQWLPMLKKAGLHPRTAQVWMAVACNRRFANANPDSLLPPCATTLNLISRLPEDVYQGLLADGTINPTVSRAAIKANIRMLAQKADEERIRNLVPVPGRFRTLVVDPPWESGAWWGSSRACPYATMSQPQLLDLPVPQWLLDDAHVYLWATDGELENAIALFKHWGVLRKDLLVWNKTWPNGQRRMGMGFNFRRTCEFVLFGVRGKLRTRQSFGTGFEAPVSRVHSEKPDEFYEIVRAASYPPFGELFGRKLRDGFVKLHQESVQGITRAAA
jgi:N6-adenosine-specific RNA methylase IME4